MTEPLRPGAVPGILESFRRARVWVAGDVMLDQYVGGDVRRVSPEAPVPVVEVGETYDRLGGAANVAHGLAALGAEVSLCGVVGADPAGDALIAACGAVGVDVRGLGRSPEWSTTRKVRVVSQRQQLLRMDWEGRGAVDGETARALVARLREGGRPDAIVLSDYAKGFLQPPAVRALIEAGGALGVPVLVDPKLRDLGAYRGATVVTPNRRELEEAAGGPMPALETPAYAEAARAVIEAAGIRSLVVTLGERGLLVVEGSEARGIRAVSREVYDVTGAGDTLIGVLALGLAAGADLFTAAGIANAAAGLVVGKFGTAVVHPDELARALARRTAEKVYSGAEFDRLLASWRARGTRIAFTNGCFDVLHAGHLSLLRDAASAADVLVVGINDDASVARLKGEGRPLVPAPERAALVAALDCVDAVVLFGEDTPLRLVERIRPDVLVKGADYALGEVVGRDVVEASGGEVLLSPLVPGRSTTRIFEEIRRRR